MQDKNQMTAATNGDFRGRDGLGRFAPGNAGKPHGAKNKMREKVKIFVEKNLEELQSYFDELEPRDKIKVLNDLLPFCISKLQSVSQTDSDGNDLTPTASIDYTRLSEKSLKEILQLTTNTNENDYSDRD